MKKTVSILVGIIICLSLIVGCSEKSVTVDAKNLVEVRFEGLDTKGEAFVNGSGASRNAVLEEYGAKTKDAKKKANFSKAFDSIKYQIVSGKNNLANGDEIRIKAVYDEGLLNEANLKIENAEFTYTVSGLEEATLLDPFAAIELVYDGASPVARVEVYNRSEEQFIRDIKYKVEPRSNLRIGDKIVVTTEIDAAKAENNGFLVPDVLTKEYTVENIDEYVKDFNDIDQAANDKMKKEAVDRVESYSTETYGSIVRVLELHNSYFADGKWRDILDDATFDSPELVSIYFNTLKQGASSDSKNEIYYVYKVTAHYSPEPDPRVVYAAVRFENAIKKADGSTDIDTVYVSKMLNPPVYSVGKDLDEVYKDAIISQKLLYETQEITP